MNTHTVTLDTSATVASTTIDVGGTLTEDGNSRTLTNTSGWLNNGTFTPNTSTVKFTLSQTITGGTTFKNLTFDANASRIFTITAGTYATTTGTLTISGASNITISTGNIDVQGNITVTNTATFGGGSATITILGTGDQTFTGPGTVNQGRLPNITINKTGGTLYLAGIISLAGGTTWKYIAGTLDATTNDSTLYISGVGDTSTITGTHTLDNVNLRGGAGGTHYIITNTLTVAGTLLFTGTSMADVDTGIVNIKGDLTRNGTGGSSGTATFVINGGATDGLTGNGNQTITGPSSGTALFPNITINKTGGTLYLAGIISLYEDKTWLYTAGTVDATTNDSTLYTFDTTTLTSNGMSFDNLTVGLGVTTLGNALTVAGNLTINASRTLTTSSSNYNVNVAGNFTNSGTYTSGTNTTTFDGSGNSTIITGGTGTTKDFNNFTVNKTGTGVAQLSTNGLDVDGTLTVTAGTLDLNGNSLSTVTTCSITGTLKLDGAETTSCTPTLNSGSTVEYSASTTAGTRNLKDWTYDNLSINASGDTLQSGANETLTGGLWVRAGTLDISTGSRSFTVASTTISGGTLTATNATLDVNGPVNITSGTFTAPSNTMTVSGNWSHPAGTYTHSSGTVSLDGTDQTLTGATTFYNLTKTDSVNDATDRILTFPALATTTISGLLTLTGTDATDRVNLVSSSPDTYWGLTANGTFSINWADVTDSDASLGTAITFTNTVDGGHNLNWSFNTAPTVDTLGPATLVNGSWTTDNTPTLTFTTADADANTVAYELTIDDTASFSSPTYQATSTYAAVGSVSTTTGVLPDASYYWRVLVGDGSATSSYATANSGAVAFKVDATTPTTNAITFSDVTKTALTATTTATDATSGFPALPFQYHNTTLDTYSGATSTPVTFTGLTANTSYTYEVGVQDLAGNWATSTTFATTTLDATAPTRSNASPTTEQPAGTTQVSITLTTSETATCKYGTTANTAYADIATTFTTTNATAHSTTVSGLTDGQSYTYYVRCTDSYSNLNTDDYTITFSVASPSSNIGGSTAAGRAQRTGATLGVVATPVVWWNPLSWFSSPPAPPVPTPTLGVGEVSPEFLPLPPETLPENLPALPRELALLVTRLPTLARTFTELGIHSLADLGKLAQRTIIVSPFANPTQTPPDLYTAFIAPQPETKTGQTLDLPTQLTINPDGSTNQKLSLPPNTKITLAIKPDSPAKEIIGYLVLDNKVATKEQRLAYGQKNSQLASLAALDLVQKEKEVEERLVLNRFTYQDDNQDGLYLAEVTTPQVAGTYEVITVITYERVDLGKKELRLTAVVDPEGYVYRLAGREKARIIDATVSLYVLNPTSQTFELWPATNYSQKNPQITDDTGTYSFLVPVGIYHLTASAPNYQSYQSESFVVTLGQSVHQNIELKSRSWWQKIWQWLVFW
jgi:hypothetical protein